MVDLKTKQRSNQFWAWPSKRILTVCLKMLLRSLLKKNLKKLKLRN